MPHVMLFFFFNDTATPEIYPLSLHDALPILLWIWRAFLPVAPRLLRARGMIKAQNRVEPATRPEVTAEDLDRKSTRLNSSHANISYAVFCLKKTLSPSRTSTIRSLKIGRPHV